MQFFDYDNDLIAFNTLMEDVEEIETCPDEFEFVIHLEAARQPKDPNALTGQKIADAISKSVHNDSSVRTNLFKATYWSKTAEPFELAKIGDVTITNDPNAENIINKPDDNTIVVNFSRLIFNMTNRTKGGQAFVKKLSEITEWSTDTVETAGFSQFGTALGRAYNRLAIVAKRYLKDPTAEENTFDETKPDKPTPQGNPEDKSNAAKQTDDKQNSQVQNADESKPQDQNADESKQQDQNADESKSQNQQTQQNQNEVKPPKSDDVAVPENDGEIDPKKLYSTIVKDFRDNHERDLEIDCATAKQNGADEGTINQLTDEWYGRVMEPYEDQADDATKDKVHRLVEFYVNKYAGTSQQTANRDKKNDDNDDDFNFAGSSKSDKGNNGSTTVSTEDDDPRNKKGLRAWFNNTMKAYDDAGITNKELYHRPTISTGGTKKTPKKTDDDLDKD